MIEALNVYSRKKILDSETTVCRKNAVGELMFHRRLLSVVGNFGTCLISPISHLQARRLCKNRSATIPNLNSENRISNNQ